MHYHYLSYILFSLLTVALSMPIRFSSPVDPFQFVKKFNLNFVEQCYYGRNAWKANDASACQLLVGKARTNLPKALVAPLQALYRDYADNEPLDLERLVDCALKHRSTASTICLDHFSQNNTRLNTIREANAQRFFQLLEPAFKEMDICLDLDQRMVSSLPEMCFFIDEIELVEHCFLHHQLRKFKPCQGISYPNIALPHDARSLYRYSAWKNISTEYRNYHFLTGVDLALDIEQMSDPMAIVLSCMHSNWWQTHLDHKCQNVTKPLDAIHYSADDTHLQALFKQEMAKDVKRDCEHFHGEDSAKRAGICTPV